LPSRPLKGNRRERRNSTPGLARVGCYLVQNMGPYMSTAHTAKSPGGAGPYATNEKQPADFTADATEKIALDAARREKLTANLIAQFALKGHVVHRGTSDDYLVCKGGLSFYAQDASALQDFARLVGAAP